MSDQSKTEGLSEPLFRKLDCYSLPVENLDSAITFYGALGHQLIWREGTHAAGLRLPESDAELEIVTPINGIAGDVIIYPVERRSAKISGFDLTFHHSSPTI